MADARGSTATVRLGATASDGRAVRVLRLRHRHHLPRLPRRLRGGPGRRPRRAGPRTTSSGGCPRSRAGDGLDARELRADGHETTPPPRYTEASLIKALEERGIGRPSTYEPTIRVIQDRGYVTTKGSAFVPTWLAFAVTRLLEEHFGRLVDYDFTAAMEEDLDRIAAGQEDRARWLSRFYFDVGRRAEAARRRPRRHRRARHQHGRRSATGSCCASAGTAPTSRRRATDGEEPRRASVPDDVAPDELTVEKARELLETNADGDRALGTDPDTGRTIVARNGRFGPYVTEVVDEGERVRAQGRAQATHREPVQEHAAADRHASTTRSGCSRCPGWSAPTRRPARRSRRRTAATGRT